MKRHPHWLTKRKKDALTKVNQSPAARGNETAVTADSEGECRAIEKKKERTLSTHEKVGGTLAYRLKKHWKGWFNLRKSTASWGRKKEDERERRPEMPARLRGNMHFIRDLVSGACFYAHFARRNKTKSICASSTFSFLSSLVSPAH